MKKIKAGVFDGPKIRQLLKDKQFIETMSPEEKNGWIAFSQVVNNFLSNTKSPEYKEIVKTLLDNTVQHKKTQRQNELILVNLGVLNTNMKFIFF